PVTAMINPATRGELGPEWVEERKKALGLDRPMIYRYGLWLKELLSGNLGYSLVGGQPVAEQIGARIGPTLLLMVSAITLGTVIGIPLGVYSALRPNSWTDYLLTIFGFLAISTPVFFLGLASMYVFAVNLKWLPTSGMRTLGIPASTTDLIKHMIMPVSVLALVHIPLVMRYTRASMIESFRQDYVTTARAKGLRERAVVIWHAFRNALIPLITIIGLSLPELLSGAVITETIFQWPGMGLLAMRAVNARDYPLVLGVILVTACMVLISNLIADLCYAVADPRIRYR
ncbi:MAG: ABC transporter permease, partial [Thermomicrobiales bacterium]|nr:ABC transporter permease [Thermomicrobiales bacterium]